MRIERIKAGQTIRAEDFNRLIDAVNSLEISVAGGLTITRTTTGITIGLDDSPEKVIRATA